MRSATRFTSLVVTLAVVAACDNAKAIDDARLRAADSDSANWLMYGRTYDDHRFSPLKQVNDQTVAKLGLAWSHEFATTRGLEATPLVDHGIMYVSGNWNVVSAIDAKTGDVRWTYDPKVPRARIALFICCDAVSRGVALYKGKVYVATLDGRLIALDQKTGTPVWTTQTVDTLRPYVVSGYPRVAKGLVLIGNAGAEYGVRGYISAYDAETGKMVWRSYTVPGDPSKGFESKAIEAAAKTWDGDWWTVGGGGTTWEGIVYDPELDLMYFGTGNAVAWYRSLRGSGKPMDNLYTASILAVHASNGEIAWYFQTAPGDNWDFDSTQPLMQADLTIDGKARKVIMQANKNGFFYVLDRATGKFISGTPFVKGITWATGLDSTGRPIESPTAYDGAKAVLVSPDPSGAHNWNPMAFSPATGFVYLPAKTGTTAIHAPSPTWKYNPDRDNIGFDENYDGPLNAKFAALPNPVGELIAWDPVKREVAWRAGYPSMEGGGVLATAGNLVFQGRSDGIIAAYGAADGKKLWEFDAGTGIMAPPITYVVDGVQYVSVLAGWGGPTGTINPPNAGIMKSGFGRILTFAIGATATLKVTPYGHTAPPVPAITVNATPAMIKEGGVQFGAQCVGCHGVNAVAGPLPDLRYATKETHAQFEDIVLGGKRADLGMPSFKKILTPDKVRAIQAYVLSRAEADSKAATKPAK